MKLIHTKDYLLLIDEKAEIEEKNYFFLKSYIIGKNSEFEMIVEEEVFQRKVSKSNPELFIKDGFINGIKNGLQHNCQISQSVKIIAYYPLTKEAKELDLPLLPNPFEDNCKSFFENIANTDENLFSMLDEFSFRVGYKAAQSKQFSLEDIEQAVKITLEDAKQSVIWSEEYYKHLSKRIIQSLSTQQLPKEFIPEYEDKIAIDGHTTIGKEFKTITNSEGKEELVGTYR